MQHHWILYIVSGKFLKTENSFKAPLAWENTIHLKHLERRSASRKHVSDKLHSLSPEKLETLKEAFIKNDHPRFRKEIAANRHMPYGTAAAYAEGIKNASMEDLLSQVTDAKAAIILLALINAVPPDKEN